MAARPARWRPWLAALALPGVLALAGCASPPRPPDGDLPASLASRTELTGTPFFPQDDFQCGPAALATVLQSAGFVRTPEALVEQVYLPARQGSLQPEMLAATRRAGALPYRLRGEPGDLLREVAAGHPVLVLQNLRWRWLPQWHYAVVVGYDRADDSVILRSGTQHRLVMARGDFDRTWALADRWAFVALPPGRLPATAREPDFVAAAAALERVSPAAGQRAYEAALSTWPRNLFARLALGNAAYRQGRADAALRHYAQATQDHPDAADAWNNLAQVLLERSDTDRARQAAARAVALGGPRAEHYAQTLRKVEAAAPAAPRQ